MDALEKYFVSRRVVYFEAIAFLATIVLIWIDEVMDIPHLFFNAPATPINWQESTFESLIILILGAAIVNYTTSLFRRMKYIEGILPICASCKKIRVENGSWHQIESYIRERSGANFSHGICPECTAKLYPDFNPYQNKK